MTMNILLLFPVSESHFFLCITLAYIILSIVTFYSIRLVNKRKFQQKKKKLYKEKEKAEKENLLKSKFIANIDHEVRNPLNAIIGFSELICEGDNPKDRHQFSKIVSANSRTLLNIINNVLDITQIESGILEFSYSDIDINMLLSDICQQTIAKNANPNVEIRFTEKLHQMVLFTDKRRITQVINNLLNNALKFTQEGEITFGYRLCKNRQICFFVKDTGIGIPQSKTTDVFERFTRLNRQVKGVGLGLPLARVIIERLKGTIGVRSELNVGSEFWFKLPAKSIIKVEKKERKEKKKWSDLQIQKIPLQRV